MKTSSILKIAVLAIPLFFASCGSKKHVTEQETATSAKATIENLPQDERALMEKVEQNIKDSVKANRFLTSKVKFTVEYGEQNLTLTGNLRMKRDYIIRLQLMAFGFVEAARLEFTKDYVLIMDRINKQYIMQPYKHVDFLRNSGINFYTLQALFWNELFMPNSTGVKVEDLPKYSTTLDGNEAIIGFEDEKMNYSWLVNKDNARIIMANILYRDRLTNGTSQLTWDYQDFESFGSGAAMRPFPTQMNISLNTTESKEVKLRMKLNYLDEAQGWEDPTQVSNKYREVSIEDMLKRFMAL
jgi:hypothetical protein